MDFKEMITPLVTLAAVWLAANFTLRNELRKKELEIKATYLEKLSEKCDSMLLDLINYSGSLAGILDSSPILVPGNNPVCIGKLNEWLSQLDDSPRGLDQEKLRWCSHGLEFHRIDEWKRWQDNVQPLQHKIYEFFMITLPGENNVDMSGKSRTRDEITAFAADLRVRMKSIQVMRQDIVSAMAADFRLLTQPVPRNIFNLTSSLCRCISNFFKH